MLTDLQMRYSLVGIIVGALAVYLVSRVVQRAALLGAGAVVMFIAAFTVFVVELFREAGVGAALRTSLWGLAQGLLAWVLVVLVLLLLDLIFNLNTPLRLLELANPAQPLLKRLLQVAPGTYNHSIQMGNLAEAAAEAIGADPLLARVGAYYHDIGKIVRPEYFVENQIYVDNPHDRLSPNLSKLAITAHVRDGEQLAKQNGLPTPVIEIIRQHHGTSVLSFFYHKAKTASREPVDEEAYRYEEEKPRSKEAAIIMLADGVEAAVRALSHPTRRKIQGVIQEVFKQRIQDGQLDESELTLGDLHKIQEAFDTTLRGQLGHRIKYPSKNDERGSAAVPSPRIDTPTAPTADALPSGVQTMPSASQPRLRVPPSAAVLRSRRRGVHSGREGGDEHAPSGGSDGDRR
jgi:putative nucleotidyltransferase with HDIG domain